MKNKGNVIAAVIISAVIAATAAFTLCDKYLLSVTASSAMFVAKNLGSYSEQVEAFKANVNAALKDSFAFKERYVELYGITQRLFSADYVTMKGSWNIARLDNGLIYGYTAQDNSAKAVENAQKVLELKQEINSSGKEIPLMFTLAPCKLDKYNPGLPYGLEDYVNREGDAFLKTLVSGGVDCLDLRESFHADNLDYSKAFFKTDLHWRPEAAFAGCAAMMDKVREDYGFEIDTALYDLDNYSQTVHENVFLGGEGSSLGKYYAGTDGVTVILPRFETDFKVVNERVGWNKRGTFEQTVINTDALDKNNKQGLEGYNVYYSRDSEITNMLQTNGKRLLFVRDSFGGIIGGFAALGASETKIVDMRTLDASQRLAEIVDDFEPDLVLFLYNTSIVSNSELFGF